MALRSSPRLFKPWADRCLPVPPCQQQSGRLWTPCRSPAGGSWWALPPASRTCQFSVPFTEPLAAQPMMAAALQRRIHDAEDSCSGCRLPHGSSLQTLTQTLRGLGGGRETLQGQVWVKQGTLMTKVPGVWPCSVLFATIRGAHRAWLGVPVSTCAGEHCWLSLKGQACWKEVPWLIVPRCYLLWARAPRPLFWPCYWFGWWRMFLRPWGSNL